MLTVYHGSTMPVEHPSVSVGRSLLDFGQGFYLTDIRQQAILWASRAANVSNPQWLNVYYLDMEAVRKNFCYHHFEAYDKQWLDFIVNCRRGMDVWKAFDLIEGGVADDRVIDTVNLFMLGIIPEELAIARLAQHQPNNQICILNQEIIQRHLTFVQAKPLNELAKRSLNP
jgi:hypothetical protein